MDEPNYKFSAVDERLTFEFDSVSTDKVIRKLVQFRLIDFEAELYNLALVDILFDGSASGLSVSNNNDMPKVLATVFRTLLYFFDRHKDEKILIQGSTKSRTRLYQMAIVKYLPELEHKFEIWGFVNNEFEDFTKGKSYNGFVIKQK